MSLWGSSIAEGGDPPPEKTFVAPAVGFIGVDSAREPVERLVGAGGWAYFQVPGEDSLRAYARAFPFVEVNSTFYDHPDPRTVSAWRRRVPPSFRFAVRAHRRLTHRHPFRASPAARESFAWTGQVAKRLGADAVVLETPDRLAFGSAEVSALRDLLAVDDLACPAGLEARAYAGRGLPRSLAAVMEASDVADVVDFSRQSPRTRASVAYGRMFGLGDGNRWEFTDDELVAARMRAERGDTARVMYTFHGIRMYKDAARFLTFVRTGKFPPTTRHTGLASLEEILREDVRFPATTAVLVDGHGWRVIDLAADRRIHAGALLKGLPPRTFASPEAVVAALAGEPRATSC